LFFFVKAPDSGANDSYGVWKIVDKDNSFLTQPFRIKYARQDIRLCMMISFTLPLERYEGSATSAAILKFELMYAPSVDNASAKQLDTSPVAVHEFRIPPKALTGLHSYCPVHFDTLHAVLIDVSVHISVLKSAAYKRPASLSRFVNIMFGFDIIYYNICLGSYFYLVDISRCFDAVA
jgi:hypothetical protein